MQQDLVAVTVITYNSGQFVFETLESVKSQTYRNIELIISDDCSSDNTLEIVHQWLSDEGNRLRFAYVQLITTPKNSGVSANCNRAAFAAKAEWIKQIAGDDILLPNCIEDNMKFMEEHPETRILFSKVKIYKNEFKAENYLNTKPVKFPSNLMDPAFSSDHQFKLLLISDRINYSPSYFFFRQAIVSVGGYDEKSRLVEDYPMWLKLTKAGFRFYFMDKATVGYRQHEQAISNFGDEKLFKPMFLKMYAFRRRNVHPYLPWDMVWSEKFVMAVSEFFETAGLNKNKSILRALYTVCTAYLNPFRYVVFFKKRILGLENSNIFYRN